MAAKRGRTVGSFGQAFTPLSVSGGRPVAVTAIVDLTLSDRTVDLMLKPRTIDLTLKPRTVDLTLEKR